MTTVAVTGATGFLGGHLVRALHTGGHRVRALVRAASRTNDLEARGVDVRRVRFDDPVQLGRELEGADGVIHAAGGGSVIDPKALAEQNAGLTTRLLEAARLAGVKRFVLVSSLAAAGPSGSTPRREDDPLEPISLYGCAKRDAERAALEVAGAMEIQIARPPSIYGPHDTRFMPLFSAAARGFVPLPPTERLSIVYGPDCADALVLLATTSIVKSGEIFFITHPESTTFQQIAELAGQALGRSHVRTFRIPRPILRGAAQLSEQWGRLRDRPTPFGTDKARDGSARFWLCSGDKLFEHYGWRATTPLDVGIRSAIQAAKLDAP